ncbi:MAG: bifunctional DNA-formamidopyrimidine glycosylase/DNA-(apurinic or apyrimidinic site) lyase [Candidatus Obscuribacterales bacterium]|nr:bifunctional DNA-formamidopyrimidine glycosylase/DNA-(apurinic or apyrimidinic site) lyase [Candidatus Obscuribacterales bacterium]
MPELPEVETVRRGLEKQLSGAKIKSVKVLRKDSVGYPSVEEFTSMLKGREFHSVGRRGKYLLLKLSDNTGMVAHLRMSGRLLVMQGNDVEPGHVRIRIGLTDGRKLIFDDTRVFGRLWCVPEGESFESVVETLNSLGPEPLDGINPKYLQTAFQRKTQSIKIALLDQSIIAGVGNIYADESLHRAGIHPNRQACSLTLAELKRLSKELQIVLNNAIEAGGSTLRDYTDSSGVNGNYQHEALVYGRKDEPCRKCKSKIERIKLAGRSSHFCPRCQR